MTVDPRAILPHREPFLFLDDIEELGPTRARGRYRFKGDEAFFRGHFPADPVVPGVIQIEMLGQLLVAMGLTAAREARLPVENIYFSVIESAQFHRPLRPGDEVVAEIERVWFRMRTIQARGAIRLAETGELVAEGVLRGSGAAVAAVERE